ncbi:MAG TPA: carbonic anhydrase [Phycisphaerae bacterium]|nr:carbonic anhydrase [Phycisphaerae bacterium]
MSVQAIPFTSPFPFVRERVGAAAIYCSDGRYGEQMDDFLHNCLGLPHYDRVAIPGGAACLAGHLLAMRERGALDRQIKFLVESHGLARIVLIAHQDCGFYKHNVHPSRLRQKSLEEVQFADLAAVASLLRDFCHDLDVDAYFARRVDELVRFDPVAT